MRLLPRSLKWRTVLLTLLGLVAVGVSGWWTFRTQISAYVKQQQTLDKLRRSPHAIDRAVGSGELRVGMSVDEFAATHPPRDRLQHDEYDTLSYEGNHRRDSIRVIAVNGRIVFAGERVDEPAGVFVGGMSADECGAYIASIRRWSERYIVGRAALGGVAGCGSLDRWMFPTPPGEDLSESP
jgi:hypothetical protein